MKTPSGTGIAGRVKYIGSHPVRFTSRKVPGDAIHSWGRVTASRIWSWRSVDDPRQNATGFATLAAAEVDAWEKLVKFDH